MLGEFSPDGGETPEPESTSAAGTTPAEPATGTEPETASEPAAAGDGAATSASDGTTPNTPTASAADEADPFADTTPATFTVNGKPMTNEDIRVFKEGGAVIRPEALPNVLNRLSERESLFERNRAQSVEYQTLSKATEWVDQSSGKTYTGPDAAIEMRIGNASMFAENQLLIQAITDPEQLARCLTTEKGQDGVERVVFSPAALDELRRENSLRQREVAAAIRDHFKTVIADAQKPQPAPLNFETETPLLVKALAEQSKLDASLLTPEDHKLLAEQLPFHIKDGQASVAWQNLAKRMMATAAATRANAATVASVTQKATLDGAARMAAAARGVKQTPRPTAPVVTPAAVNEKAANEGDAWDIMERNSAAVMRSLR